MKRFLIAVAAGLLAFLDALIPAEPQSICECPLCQEGDIEPGDWFVDYVSDWKADHDIEDDDDVTSGIIFGKVTGRPVWATATPEWDQEWFSAHGMKFPTRWVPFFFLGYADAENDGDVLEIPDM
jgi:hypothetical protein